MGEVVIDTPLGKLVPSWLEAHIPTPPPAEPLLDPDGVPWKTRVKGIWKIKDQEPIDEPPTNYDDQVDCPPPWDEAWEGGTQTGRLPSDKPNLSNQKKESYEQHGVDTLHFPATVWKHILHTGRPQHGKRQQGKDWIRRQAEKHGYPFRFAACSPQHKNHIGEAGIKGVITFNVSSKEQLEEALREVYGG